MMSSAPSPETPTEQNQRMAGLQRGAGERRDSRAEGYSRFVQYMRVMLPLAALVVVMLLIIWPQFERPYSYTSDVDLESQPDLKRDVQTNRLVTARFENVDSKGRPYVIEADEAAQQKDNPDIIDLAYPKARIQLDEGTSLRVKAKEGEFTQGHEHLYLSGGTYFTRSDGTVLQTQSIRSQLKQGTAQTTDPVFVEGPSGRLDAQGMRIENEGMRVIFEGPAVMHIYTKDRIVPGKDITATPAAERQSADEER